MFHAGMSQTKFGSRSSWTSLTISIQCEWIMMEAVCRVLNLGRSNKLGQSSNKQAPVYKRHSIRKPLDQVSQKKVNIYSSRGSGGCSLLCRSAHGKILSMACWNCLRGFLTFKANNIARVPVPPAPRESEHKVLMLMLKHNLS